MLRDALARYAVTLPADHQLAGIGRVRLGRVLLREKRFAEADSASRAGYDISQERQFGNELDSNRARRSRDRHDSLQRPELMARARSASKQ